MLIGKYSVSGIKCDYCDYKDDTVKVEDYPNWLNKPCPECGENLLTKKAYKTIKSMMFHNKVMDFLFPKEKCVRVDHARYIGTSDKDGNIEWEEEQK